MGMAQSMYDQVSDHSTGLNMNCLDEPTIKEWRLQEDLLDKKGDHGLQIHAHNQIPPLEQCFNTELQLDTDKIYGRKKQKRTMMISASETVVGKLGKDTCSADILCVIDISGSMGGEKLNNVKTTSWNPLEVWRCFKLKAWDEETGKMITMRQLKSAKVREKPVLTEA